MTWVIGVFRHQKTFIGKLDFFSLMCAADQVWITELTLIHKNSRSVRNSHAPELTLILKIIGQCNVKHILTSPIKTFTSVLKISTYIITARTVGLAAILAIMSVLAFRTDVILYVLWLPYLFGEESSNLTVFMYE